MEESLGLSTGPRPVKSLIPDEAKRSAAQHLWKKQELTPVHVGTQSLQLSPLWEHSLAALMLSTPH